MKKNIVMSALVLLLCGCASYYNGPRQEMEVHTAGVNGVDCSFTTKDATLRMVAPGKIKLERSPEKLTVVCSKAGYIDAIQVLEPMKDMEYTTANAANGFVFGVLYDQGTKAIYKYQPMIVMEMKPDPNRIKYQQPEPFLIKKKEAPAYEDLALPVPSKEKTQEDKEQLNKTMRKSLTK